MNISKLCFSRSITRRFRCRKYSQNPVAVEKEAVKKHDMSRIRNIGILAHIDAGKTTTTERMLYYSGKIGEMGEVHHGNTVTDFMEQERQRGITITAAAVTFRWGKYSINLLDTPGHIDFTMEVEQTLNVMDGAVVILDGAAGVEAQTVTVWKQADKYKIPRIIYINKMDKLDAKFAESVQSIEDNLCVPTLILQLPLIKDSKFQGVVDIMSMEKYEWDPKTLGATYSRKALSSNDGKLWEDATKARMNLTENLADLDDKMAEMIIKEEKMLECIPTPELKECTRRLTLEKKAFPVFCGSSYKNIGVQLLLDGVVDYLPSPACSQNQNLLRDLGDNLCARAFKVRHDNFKGPITFFRIYSGNLTKGKKVYNVKKEKSEVCGRVYVAYADDYEEVEEVDAGNIAAVTGLKHTSSGDLVTSSLGVYQSAKEAAKKSEKVLLAGAYVPDPVFYCSVEAFSERQQTVLDKALRELEKEDPSLRVTTSEETGQTVLGGMGELHLEVVRERIRSEYKVDASLGHFQIAYKEALIQNTKGGHSVHHKIGNGVHTVNLTMSVLLSDSEDSGKLLLDRSPDSVENISSIFPKHLLAVERGIESALECGPKLNYPVINANVMLHMLEVGRGTSDSIITSATSQCVKKLLKMSGTKLLEPIMFVEVNCHEKTLQSVLNDLERRRAELESTTTRDLDVIVRAFVPLSELLGYAKALRILSSGTSNFSMVFHSLKEMDPENELKAIKTVSGVF